jgi:hypothetical protein
MVGMARGGRREVAECPVPGWPNEPAYGRAGSQAAVRFAVVEPRVLTHDDTARAIEACRRCDVVLALGENNRF